MLAQEVLRVRCTISHEHPWEVMPDLYFYRDPGEVEEEEFQGEWMAPAPEVTALTLGSQAGLKAQVPSGPVQQFPTEKPGVVSCH